MKKTIRIILLTSVSVSIILGACKKKETCCNPTPPPTSIILKPGPSTSRDAVLSTNAFGTANNNYGSIANLITEAWTNGGSLQINRGIIDFDLSSIPTGKTITSAKLLLYADTTNIIHSGDTKANNGHSQLSGPNNWVLKRITSSWNANTVTWNTQPTTDPNNVINLPASTSRYEAYEIDVTKFINDQYSNPSNYHGFVFNLADENYYRCIIFCSSDHQNPAFWPELRITYNN